MIIWTVPATVVRVVDGDTLILDLDLGWRVWRRGERCRLAGINCPELRTDAGHAAVTFVRELLPPMVLSTVIFRSSSLDKYGRPLGDVELPDGRDLATVLLGAGHAVEA
jgi:micrococcal nuclease